VYLKELTRITYKTC